MKRYVVLFGLVLATAVVLSILWEVPYIFTLIGFAAWAPGRRPCSFIHTFTASSPQVSDKRLLKLIRAFLNAGVMENGLVSPTEEGTPQGGQLSPILPNLLLDDLDRELTRRGLRSNAYFDSLGFPQLVERPTA